MARVDWSKKMLQKYYRGASKHVYDNVTGDKSWIYAYELESKQQSTVWAFQDEPNPTKVIYTRSTSKQMFVCFSGNTGHVAILPLEQRRRRIFQEIRKTNRRRRNTLHHDNASCHTSAQTTAFLSTQNIDLMIHPPYSPDLAPNDPLLFPYVKTKMRRQRFSTPEEAVDAFRMHVLEIPQSEVFDNWFKRMQKCIELNGECFEK